MADFVYNEFKWQVMKEKHNLATDVVKVALFTSTHTPNKDSDVTYSSLTNEVAAGGGYTTGGAAIGSPTVTKDNTDDEGVFDGADVQWTSATITARYAVLYNTSAGGTNDLICIFDFGSDKSSTNGTFKIEWNAEGIINLT